MTSLWGLTVCVMHAEKKLFLMNACEYSRNMVYLIPVMEERVMRSLDEIDYKLLELLRTNARMPLKDLSAEVFLSTPAVSARIEKLENDGFIKGYHAATDYEKLGNGIKAFIMITVRPEDKPEFIDFIRNKECVIECNHITGNYSMIVKAMFPSTTPMNTFVGELQKYGKTQTQVVFETVIERY